MSDFGYLRPNHPDAAIAAALRPGARFLAGGTNLLDLVKYGVEQPDQLIDIGKLALKGIEERADGSVRIGALTTNSEMAWHPAIRDRYPVLSEALLAGATPQLRNAATLAGNMLQRTRCWYFYDTATPCNKRAPGSGCGALAGCDRKHAVLGTSEWCIAVHPSDMSVALAALEATVNTRGPSGERSIAFTDLHRLPGDTPHIETSLSAGELITSVDLPPLKTSRRSHYRKVRDRESFDFALASAAVALDVNDNVIRDARVALGGIATKPWRAQEAERELKGRPADESTFEKAAHAALRDARPHRQNAYKIELARRTLVEALLELVS